MRALTPRQYLAVTLTFWGGMTQLQVGVEMGISERAAGRLIERATMEIKNVLGGVQKPTSQTLTHVRGERNPAERSIASQFASRPLRTPL